MFKISIPSHQLTCLITKHACSFFPILRKIIGCVSCRKAKKKSYITCPVFTVGDPKQHESSMVQKVLIKLTREVTGDSSVVQTVTWAVYPLRYPAHVGCTEIFTSV